MGPHPRNLGLVISGHISGTAAHHGGFEPGGEEIGGISQRPGGSGGTGALPVRRCRQPRDIVADGKPRATFAKRHERRTRIGWRQAQRAYIWARRDAQRHGVGRRRRHRLYRSARLRCGRGLVIAGRRHRHGRRAFGNNAAASQHRQHGNAKNAAPSSPLGPGGSRARNPDIAHPKTPIPPMWPSIRARPVALPQGEGFSPRRFRRAASRALARRRRG